MASPLRYPIGQRWRCDQRSDGGQPFDFVILDPREATEHWQMAALERGNRLCRLEAFIPANTEPAMALSFQRRAHHGMVSTYSTKHLKRYARLVPGTSGDPRIDATALAQGLLWSTGLRDSVPTQADTPA